MSSMSSAKYHYSLTDRFLIAYGELVVMDRSQLKGIRYRDSFCTNNEPGLIPTTSSLSEPRKHPCFRDKRMSRKKE
jgi:hypothetical protein